MRRRSRAKYPFTVWGGLSVLMFGLVLVISIRGCGPSSKGPLGAATLEQLANRYKVAHQQKDIPALRSIHLQLGFGFPIFGSQMVGGVEKDIPQLFSMELIDVKLVKVDRKDSEYLSLDYCRKRIPMEDNGFSPVSYDSVHISVPYKLILLGRRPGEKDGPIMEVDPCISMTQFKDRYFLYIATPMASDVTEWIKTGKIPEVYRPPSHFSPLRSSSRKHVPKDWIPIVRPHDGA